MKPVKPNECVSCNRAVALSFHHYVPKKMHGKVSIEKRHADKDLNHYGDWFCNDCHKKIHRLFDHRMLAEHYYDLEKIMSEPTFLKFVNWVRKQKKRVK